MLAHFCSHEINRVAVIYRSEDVIDGRAQRIGIRPFATAVVVERVSPVVHARHVLPHQVDRIRTTRLATRRVGICANQRNRRQVGQAARQAVTIGAEHRRVAAMGCFAGLGDAAAYAMQDDAGVGIEQFNLVAAVGGDEVVSDFEIERRIGELAGASAIAVDLSRTARAGAGKALIADDDLYVGIHCAVGVMREKTVDQKRANAEQLAFHVIAVNAAGLAHRAGRRLRKAVKARLRVGLRPDGCRVGA